MNPITPNQRGAIALDMASPFVQPVQLEILNTLVRFAVLKAKSGWERLQYLTAEVWSMLPVVLIAGFASYLNRKRDPNEPNFTWPTFLAHMTATVVSGLTAIHIALYYGVDSINAIAVIASLAGWAGRDGINWVIYVFKVRVLNDTGLKKQADREVYDYSDGRRATFDTTDAPIEPVKTARIGSKEEFLAAQAEKKKKSEETAP